MSVMRVTVYMTMPEADIESGWGGDVGELEESVRATLHELVGDDGDVYVPHVLGIDVEPDDG